MRAEFKPQTPQSQWDFGLVRTRDQTLSEGWASLLLKVAALQQHAHAAHDANPSVPATRYKLVFVARHGEGWHNVASDYYGPKQFKKLEVSRLRYYNPTKYPTGRVYNPDDPSDTVPDPVLGNGQIRSLRYTNLTDVKGVGQAKELARRWTHQLGNGCPRVGVVLCSPLQRTIQTAVIAFGPHAENIRAHQGVKSVLVEQLREKIQPGQCESESDFRCRAVRRPGGRPRAPPALRYRRTPRRRAPRRHRNGPWCS